MPEEAPKMYDEKIIKCFTELCKKNGGASPSEVYLDMSSRGWLSSMDTVIDIADLMRELRDRGRL